MKPLLPNSDMQLDARENRNNVKQVASTQSNDKSDHNCVNNAQSLSTTGNIDGGDAPRQTSKSNHDVTWLVDNKCTLDHCHGNNVASRSTGCKQSIIRKTSSPLPASMVDSTLSCYHHHHHHHHHHESYFKYSGAYASGRCDDDPDDNSMGGSASGSNLTNAKVSTSARCLALEAAYVHEVYAQIARSYGACSPIRSHIKEFIFDEFEYGSLIMDIGCGDGKYLNLNPGVIIIGLERCADWFMSQSEFACHAPPSRDANNDANSDTAATAVTEETFHAQYEEMSYKISDARNNRRSHNNQVRNLQTNKRRNQLPPPPPPLPPPQQSQQNKSIRRRQSKCTQSAADRLESSQFLLGDIIHVPLRDELLDGILCCGVLHHISTNERRINALREISRLLRVGGKVLITVWAFEGRELGSQDVLIKWNSDVDSSYVKSTSAFVKGSSSKNNAPSNSSSHRTATATATAAAAAQQQQQTRSKRKQQSTNNKLNESCGKCNHKLKHHACKHQVKSKCDTNSNTNSTYKSNNNVEAYTTTSYWKETSVTEIGKEQCNAISSTIVDGCYINHLKEDALETPSFTGNRDVYTSKLKGNSAKYYSSVGGSSADESSIDDSSGHKNLGYMSGDDDSSRASNSSNSCTSTSSSSIFMNNSSDSSFAAVATGRRNRTTAAAAGNSSSTSDDSSSDSSCSTTTTTYVNRRAAYESCNSPTSEYGSCYSFVKKALLRFNLGPAAAFYYTAAAAATATSGVVGGGGAGGHTSSSLNGGAGATGHTGRRASHMSAGSGGRGGDNTSCADIEDIPIELSSIDHMNHVFNGDNPANLKSDSTLFLERLPLRRNSTCSGMRKTYSGLQNHLPFRRKSTSSSIFNRNTCDKRVTCHSSLERTVSSGGSLGRKNSLKDSFVALFKDHLSFTSSSSASSSKKNGNRSHSNVPEETRTETVSGGNNVLHTSIKNVSVTINEFNETSTTLPDSLSARCNRLNCNSNDRLSMHRVSLPVVFENRNTAFATCGSGVSSAHETTTAAAVASLPCSNEAAVSLDCLMNRSKNSCNQDDQRIRPLFNARFHSSLTHHVTHAVPAVIDEVESRYEESSSKQSSTDVTISDDRSFHLHSNGKQQAAVAPAATAAATTVNSSSGRSERKLRKLLHKSASSDSMDSLHVQQISHQTTTTTTTTEDASVTGSIDNSFSGAPKLSAYFSMPELRSIEQQMQYGGKQSKHQHEPPVFRGRRTRPSIVDLHPITFLSARKLSRAPGRMHNSNRSSHNNSNHNNSNNNSRPIALYQASMSFAISSCDTSTDVFLQQVPNDSSSLDTDFGSIEDSESIFASMELPTSPAAPTLTPSATTIYCDLSGTSTAVPFGSRLTNHSSRNGNSMTNAMDSSLLPGDLKTEGENAQSTSPKGEGEEEEAVADSDDVINNSVHIELKTQRSCSVEYKAQISPSHLSSMRRLSASPSLHMPKIINELRGARVATAATYRGATASSSSSSAWAAAVAATATGDEFTNELVSRNSLHQQSFNDRACSQAQDHETHPSVDSEESFVTIIPADRSCRGSIDVTTSRDIDNIDMDTLGAAVSSSCAIDFDEDIDDDLDRAITATHNESDGGSFLDEVVLDMDAHDISDIDVASFICGPVLGPGAICPADYLRPPSKPVYPSRQESACLTPASICSNVSGNSSSGSKIDHISPVPSRPSAVTSKHVTQSTGHRGVTCASSLSASSRTSSASSGLLETHAAAPDAPTHSGELEYEENDKLSHAKHHHQYHHHQQQQQHHRRRRHHHHHHHHEQHDRHSPAPGMATARCVDTNEEEEEEEEEENQAHHYEPVSRGVKNNTLYRSCNRHNCPCCSCPCDCINVDDDCHRNVDDTYVASSSGTSTPSPPANLHRYFHLFRCGELEDLIVNNVEHLHVVRSYYSEHATSWCVICEKIQVWTI